MSRPLHAEPEPYRYEVIARADHDPTRSTQGFAVDGDWFYESSGLYGKSYLTRYHRKDPGQSQRANLPDNLFAEGLTLMGERLFLLSWREGIVGVYDKKTLRLRQSIPYQAEAWGLAYDGRHLIVSNGKDQLRFVSAMDFSVVKTVSVHSDGIPFDKLNELEYAQGLVWANQLRSTHILGIDPDSGEVKALVDIAALQKEATAGEKFKNVANGIAWDETHQGFWVTGKFWRYSFLLRWMPRQEPTLPSLLIPAQGPASHSQNQP